MPKKLIGTESYQVPRNADLGTAAFQDAESVNITGGVISLGSSSTTGYFQDTDISDVKPSLMLDFANTKTLDPRITFTRASTATYYDGETVAKAEENLLKYSQNFDNGYWSKAGSSVIANSTVAPDGSLTAYTLVENTSNSVHQAVVGSLVKSASDTVVASVYAKANTRTWIVLDNFYTGGVYFDLSNGTVGTANGGVTGSIVSVGNGWYRCIISSTANMTTAGIGINIASNSSTQTYTGDGTSGVYIWGAQVEIRSSATAYTPTTTSPITKYIPVLQTIWSNVPRFDHDPVSGESKGLLIEEQRTNLLTYSSDFSNGVWTKSGDSVASNTNIAPDGTLTASTLTATGTASLTLQNVSGFSAGATVTFSVFLKRTNNNWVLVGVSRAGATTYGEFGSWFNLSTGTAGSTFSAGTNTFVSKSITPVGNDWYRCTVTGYVPSAIAYTVYTVASAADAQTGSSIVGASRLVWGAQLEAGSFATSYIPTTSAQSTRQSDIASMTGTNFSSWFNQNEGATYIEMSTTKPSSATTGVLSFWNSNYTNFIDFRNPLSQPYVAVYASSSTNITWNINSAVPAGSICKWSLSYATDDFASSVNGNTISVYPGKTQVPVVNQLLIGNLNATDTNNIGGYLRKIVYYPKRLSNAELQEMTL